MALLKGSSKAEQGADAAQKAWDGGQRFFLWEAGSSFRSATAGVAEALDEIERVGWRLEHMSHVWSTSAANHAVGYYLFRRP